MSRLKVDTIQDRSGNGISLDDSLKLKQLTTTQIDALSGMSEGEMVYDTTVSDIKIYDGDNWAKITSSAFIDDTVFIELFPYT